MKLKNTINNIILIIFNIIILFLIGCSTTKKVTLVEEEPTSILDRIDNKIIIDIEPSGQVIFTHYYNERPECEDEGFTFILTDSVSLRLQGYHKIPKNKKTYVYIRDKNYSKSYFTWDGHLHLYKIITE